MSRTGSSSDGTRYVILLLVSLGVVLLGLGAWVAVVSAEQSRRIERRNTLFSQVASLWALESDLRDGYDDVVRARLNGDAPRPALAESLARSLAGVEALASPGTDLARLMGEVRASLARIDAQVALFASGNPGAEAALSEADREYRRLVRALSEARDGLREQLSATAEEVFRTTRRAGAATMAASVLCVLGLGAAVWAVQRESVRRSRADVARRESSERLEEAERIAHLGHWYHDRLTGELTGSQEYYRLWGLTPGVPITAETVFERIHPHDLPEILRLHETIEKDPRPVRLEFRVIRNAETRRFSAHVTPRTDSSGRLVATFGTLQDITELAEARAARRASEERLRAVIRATRQVLYDWDTGANVARIEGACEEVLGVPPGEIGILEKWESRIHPDDLPAFRRERARSIAERRPFQLEYRLRREDGSYVPVLDRGSCLEDQPGTLHQVGTILDLTDRKRLEHELLQAQKLESIGRLAGGIAHDFNNYLTAIFGYVDLARAEGGLPASVQEHLRRIEEAGQGAARLTGQLLAYARRKTIEPRVCSLNDVVSSATRLLVRLLRENIRLEVHTAPDLWPVRVDPGQFEQVVVNLAINARDAMPEGGRLTIETANVTLSPDYAASHPDVIPGEHVMLAVSDTGRGIPPEHLVHIFEPFFTTKRRGEGTGLGLATVHGLVKQHRGHIWVYSEVGKGTTFKIYIPREYADVETVAPVAGMPRDTTGTETILLVEDEPLVRSLAVSVLTKAGYTVLEASSGREALELARSHEGPIHLLLTDVVLPEMSGRQVAEAIRDARPAMRVLYTSGYTDNVVVHHGILDAGVEFLPKPYSPSTLASKVREVLER
jgi:two-component system cell cycle sensor histidine kinase/response regulator CckA